MKKPTSRPIEKVTLAFALLVAMLFQACPPCSTTTVPITGNTFWADSQQGPATNTIKALYFSEVWLYPGDTVWLEFPCTNPGSPSVSGSGVYTADSSSTVKKITTSTSVSASQVVVDFSALNYKFVLNFLPISPAKKIPARVGDANADGRVDMLDLAPIAHAMHLTRLSSPRAPSLGASLRDTFGAVNWVKPSGYTWKWGGFVQEVIDFSHSDFNGDGKIDRTDFKMLVRRLNPIDMPLYLRDGLSDLEFTVVRDPILPIICFPAIGGEPPHVEVPYTVEVVGGTTSDVLGIVHRRPITETNCVKIKEVRPGLDDAFIVNDSAMLGHHELWRGGQLYLENLCTASQTTTLGVIDIGIFGGVKLHRLGPGLKVMDCIVDIQDIGRRIARGQCPIVQYDFDGLVFSVNKTGIVAGPADCNQDSLTLQPSDTCFSDTTIVTRDQVGDYGREKGSTPSAPWQSPDIWQDGSDVILRTINLSCDTVEGVDVSLYYTTEGINAQWPTDGVFVGTRTIPLIVPNGTKNISIPWSPLSPNVNYTLFAVISTTGDDNSSWFNTTLPLKDLVTMRNNVSALTL